MKSEENPKRSLFRYMVGSTILCLVFLLLKKDSIIRWVQAGFEISSQERRIEQLTKENEELDRSIGNLTLNRDSLEMYARENYGFCADGEDVYLVEE